MKTFLILSAVACVCLAARLEGHGAAPLGAHQSGGGSFLQGPIRGAPVQILRQENVNNGDGSYHYSFETGDGIKQEQSGELKDHGNGKEPSLSVTGSYSYTDPSGKLISVTYSADEFGYHPVTTLQQKVVPQTGYLPSTHKGY